MRFVKTCLSGQATEILHDGFECFDGNKDVPTVTLDFGNIPVESTVVKFLKMRNDTAGEESYEVHRDPTINPLDAVFHFNKYSWILDPGDADIFQVRYNPPLPNERSIDYFTISNKGRTILTIKVEGTSTGPKVSIANNEISLACLLYESAKKRIKLVNESNVETSFLFDVDGIQNSFKPCPSEGSIAANSHAYVLVTFEPKYEGYHVTLLPCLIHHQAPILIRLYGYAGKKLKDAKLPVVPTLIYPALEKNTFKIYMADCTHMREIEATNPCLRDPVSLSDSYIDFGRYDLNPAVRMTSSSRTTCFTNNAMSDMFIKWHDDVEGVFSLSPNEARVSAGETCLIEIRFDPREENAFYEREFQALIFYLEDDTCLPIFDVSMIASLRLIGHTFPADVSTWIPQYDVPRNIVMPPCLPFRPTYTTFLIKKSGHLPIMYRFIPPRETCFTVKPMQGVIRNNYQVIVVEMFSKNDQCLQYERWAIRFNGNPNYETFVDLRGYADQPALTFDQVLVEYPSTHPNCERAKHTLMLNPTRHHINYKFVDIPMELGVNIVEGKIYSNEIVTHTWTFCPLDEGDYERNVLCRYLASTASGYRDGDTIRYVELPVVGKCERGYLLAKPNELIIDQHPYAEPKEISFELKNPSSVEIPYLLTVQHENEFCDENNKQCLQLNPISGILCPSDGETIRLTLVPRERGYHEISIRYCARKNFQIDHPVPMSEYTEICRLKYFCQMPTIQIEDFLYHRIGGNFSKYVLQRLLNISKLNRIMEDLEPEESENLTMRVPPTIVRKDKSVIKLLVSNRTCGTMNWTFKQMKICSCSRISETRRALTGHAKKHDCPHRKLLDFQPKSGTLKPQENAVVTMELRFEVLGETTVKWDLEMGYDRHVHLCIIITCLSGLEKTAFPLFGSAIKLKSIYIADRDPINQIFWIYNPTKNNVSYSLDTGPLNKFNEDQRLEIFKCVNPYGTIDELSCEPVIIKFKPRQLGTFEVTVPLTINDETSDITIKGECTNDPGSNIVKVSNLHRHIFEMDEVPVHFNKDSLEMPPTPLHSRVTRMVMVHNRLEHELVAYKWKRYELPGILRIDLEPQTGRIQPKSLQTFRLIVTTLGRPCRVIADVICEFINQSEKRAYERCLLLQEGLREQTKDYFTITEKGTIYPEPQKITLEGPVPFCKVLTVRCDTYSLLDEELKIEKTSRLKSTPPIEIRIGKPTKRFSISTDMIPIATLVLEGIMWDIAKDPSIHARPKSLLKYSQIASKPLERQRIRARSYETLCGRTLERILENMIFMIVHEEFALDTIHLTGKCDVRQAAYPKIWQQVPARRAGPLEQSPKIQ